MKILTKSHIFIFNNHKYIGTMRFTLGFKHLYYGLIIYKYPLCCIFQFVKESWFCTPSALKRYKDYGLIWGSNPIIMSEELGEHVPCDKCMNQRLKILKVLNKEKVK